MFAKIYEIERIGNGFLAVMARPRPEDWLEDEIRSLKSQGIGSVVSLLEPVEAIDVGLADERIVCEKAEIEKL